MRIRSLGYVGVESPEYKRWIDFGPEILGLALAEPDDEGDAVRLRMDDRHHRLAIHPGPSDRLSYVGWDMANDDNLAAAIDDLNRFEVPATMGTDAECEDRRVEKLVWFEDPAGIRHELFVGQLARPNSFWPGRPMSGFVTGTQGMGHAVVLVPDQRQAKAFYTNVMGFRISDEVETFMRFYFLRCNPRHHSLSFGEVPAVRGLHHIMMEVRSLDDVGTALDLCHEREIPLVATLGRHTNDQMVSFYLRTPSGFEIEYGWGGLQVDDREWVVSTLETTDLWGHKMMPLGPPTCVEEITGVSGITRPAEGFKWEPRI